jgi:hypothetical protein
MLIDCRRAFVDQERLSTKDLIAALGENEEAPWGTWHKGSPISPRALARLLVPFGIRSRSIRIADETPKGYLRESFEDAWSRYLAPVSGALDATPPQPAPLSQEQAISIRNETSSVAVQKQAANPHGERVVAAVAARKPLLGDEMYPLLLAETGNKGHITEDEFSKLYALHKWIELTSEAS